MKVKYFIFNEFREITYIVYDEETRRGIIVDPGCNRESEQNRLVKFIEENDLSLECVVNTHGHLDHIVGNNFVKSKYGIPILAHEKEVGNFTESEHYALFYEFPFVISPLPDRYIKEGDIVSFGNSHLNVIDTPGHTAGSISLLSEKKEMIISGDVLFKGSIGRTDLPGGDWDILVDTLKDKFFILPSETQVFPGHGYITSIGEEIKSNPFLIEIIKG